MVDKQHASNVNHASMVGESPANAGISHLVTATQALRCVLNDESGAVGNASMTGALLAVHLVLGSPKILDHTLPAPQQLDQEHSYKYVSACVSEYRCYEDEDYLSEIVLFKERGLVPDWAARELLDNTN